MSAALTTAERDLLADLAVVMTLLQSGKRAELVDLVSRLLRLSHCDQCGVLFESVGVAVACQHCLEEWRREEARAATGGDL